MSEVTPGVGCFAGVGEWLAPVAGAFGAFAALPAGCSGVAELELEFAEEFGEFAAVAPVM